MESTFGERFRRFRESQGRSREDMARWLGVGRATILRWENGTSKPSSMAARALESMGFGAIKAAETNVDRIPRLRLANGEAETLRAAVRSTMLLDGKHLPFTPSPYVLNGPENQLAFFEELYKLQEQSKLSQNNSYCRRLALVKTVDQPPIITSQYLLEAPKPRATHWNANYGPHGWHRYVGRFPPHLVRSLLNHFGAKPGDTVLDPFLGSGTTLVEARLLGLNGIGIEICPLSCLISRAKTQFPNSTSRIENLVQNLVEFYEHQWETFVQGHDVAGLTHLKILNRKGNAITAFPNLEKWLTPPALLGSSILVEYAMGLSGYDRDFLLCALSACMRSIGNVDVDVVRAEYRKTPRENVNVLNLVRRALRRMIGDVESVITSHDGMLSQADQIKVREASILDVQLPDSSIDYIITSPPYGVESVSYLRTHLLSYRCLSPVLKYDPYFFDDRIVGSEYLAPDSTIDDVMTSAKTSRTFGEFFGQAIGRGCPPDLYKRTMMMAHFFDQMLDIGKLFVRWLKPRGRIAFVIGNKRLGGQVIPTSDIIIELFRSVGLQLDNMISHKLKCNNSNSEVPWQERVIQDEFVMLFSKEV